MDFKVGDWVKSYSQGIWRVERVIDNFFEMRYSFDEPKVKSKRTLYHSKRLVNDKWKRSFAMEGCSSEFINKLTNEEVEALNRFIADNEKTMKEFERYQRNLDLVLNLGFSFYDQDKLNFDSIADRLFEGKNGLTSDDIIRIIRESQLSKYFNRTPQNKTIQFISINTEIRNSEYIFKEYRI